MHGHPRSLIPFGICDIALRPVFFTADEYGADVPVWDIRDGFGDATDLLILNMDHGRDLAAALGRCRVVLLRGHGFVAAARSAGHLIRLCKALLDNAAIQLDAMRFGAMKEMVGNEMATRQRTLGDDDLPGRYRDLEDQATMAGLADLLEERVRLKAGPSS